MEQITLRACAKINLTLDILGLLPDKRHEMAMIMQSVSLWDTLTLTKERETALFCQDEALCGPDNLVLRAQALLEQEAGRPLPAHFALKKRIPVAAGLAGGSADGAAALAGLNRLYGLGLSPQRLCALGAKLGADVPFSLTGGTCLAQGDGTSLHPVENRLKGFGVVAMPCTGLSTGSVFGLYDRLGAERRPDNAGALSALAKGDWDALRRAGGNALSTAAGSQRPQIARAVWDLYDLGARYAAMSGSGPSVFGWFDDPSAADRASKALSERYPAALRCDFAQQGLFLDDSEADEKI